MSTPNKLDFSQVILITINANTTTGSVLTVPSDCVWKIESAGVGGTNGAIYLLQDFGVSPPPEKIAIIGTTIGDDDYASNLPYWLPSGFTARFQNESGYTGSVSITEYVVTAL